MNGQEVCPYLPGRTASFRNAWADELPAAEYQRLMDSGFRRVGRIVYQPVCHGCRECVPIRVPVAEFAPTKSQRRAWQRNEDLEIAWKPVSEASESDRRASHELYSRYLRGWHGGEPAEFEHFEGLYYESCVETLEFTYRDATGALLAVGFCDLTPEALSSVYFLFAPEEAGRSLGTFGALAEIEHARAAGLRYYYLGYWIEGCGAMSYKANFGPHELLGLDGIWRKPD